MMRTRSSNPQLLQPQHVRSCSTRTTSRLCRCDHRRLWQCQLCGPRQVDQGIHPSTVVGQNPDLRGEPPGESGEPAPRPQRPRLHEEGVPACTARHAGRRCIGPRHSGMKSCHIFGLRPKKLTATSRHLIHLGLSSAKTHDQDVGQSGNHQQEFAEGRMERRRGPVCVIEGTQN